MFIVVSLSCGGAARAPQVPVTESPDAEAEVVHEPTPLGPTASASVEASALADEYVRSIVVEPTSQERAQGDEVTVTINSAEGLATWVGSPAFSDTDWTQGSEGSAPRYRIAFQGPDGELAVFWIGSITGEPKAYRCFGFCSSWWVAPSSDDGQQDKNRYRVIAEQVWQALAREWYLAEKR